MPGRGPSPKPDAERRRSNPATFGWTLLAPRPRVRRPKLPGGKWSVETRAWWAQLWTRPQAVMWDPTGISLRQAARLYEAIVRGGDVARLSAELRQIEDRHGLNPKAMLQLRWRVADPGDLDGVTAAPRSSARAVSSDAARRRRVLRSLEQAS